jgi:SAM-dependent methyltransferase
MPFDLIAGAYDILSDPQKRIAREGPFLRSLIRPGMRVLDLACGTGVHAEFLARQGAEVTACDLSAAMISRASGERPHPNIRYQVGDMGAPPPGPFDLILCLGNSLNLLPDRDAAARAVQAIRKPLASGGRFLLHLINPACQAHQKPSVSIRTGEVEGREIVVVKSSVQHDKVRFLSISCHRRVSPGAQSWESAAENSILLDITVAEAQRMLELAGFASVTVWGGMDQSPLAINLSPDIVALAQ